MSMTISFLTICFTRIIIKFINEIILKQLFTSVSVIIPVNIHLDALRLGKYSPIITSTSVNNCWQSSDYYPVSRTNFTLQFGDYTGEYLPRRFASR